MFAFRLPLLPWIPVLVCGIADQVGFWLADYALHFKNKVTGDTP